MNKISHLYFCSAVVGRTVNLWAMERIKEVQQDEDSEQEKFQNEQFHQNENVSKILNALTEKKIIANLQKSAPLDH